MVEYVCETCIPGKTNGYKTVTAWASQTCKEALPESPCNISYHVGAPYTQCPDQCAGITPVPSSAPIDPTCQQTTCYDMGHFMCNTTFGGCPDGIGHCDNCGGVDCGTCSGTTPAPPGSTPTPTPPPSCIPNCIDPSISPCIATTCYNRTCAGNCRQNCYGTLPNNCSCATNLCSDQTCTGTCGGTCTGQLSCPLTTLTAFQIRRGSDWFYTDRNATNGRDITDSQNRLHICDPFLTTESSQPRGLIYVASLANTLGCDNIDPNSVKMRWLGDNTEISMAQLGSDHCVFYAPVTYSESVHAGPATFQITMKSIQGNKVTPWTNITPDLKLKVWDCNVSVSGGFFDSSGQPACTMTTPMPLGMVNNLAFGIGNSTVSANITGTSYSGANLHFAKSYLPYFNGGNASNIYGTLAVTSHATKINNAANCTGVNDIGVSNWVDPYDDTTHQLQADFAFTRLMDPWYQIIGSGLRSRANLVWAVPITAPATSRYLTLNGTNLDHGVVFYGNQSNNRNGYNGAYSPVPNWHARTTLGRPSVYNYAYLYSRLFEKQGVGTTGTSWNQRPATGPFFVNGNLSINTNNSAFAGQPLLTVVQGNLTVNPTVTQLHGLFIINGNLDIGGSNTNPLIITGSVYTRGDAHISRSLIPQTNNNNNPAVIFQYQPGYMLNLPSEVTKVLSGWRME